MAKIEFENKQALNENANIPDINKVKDSDLNEIKNVVNQTILNSLFGVYYDSWQSSETYSIGDIVIYDAILYENLTGNNTATTPDQDSTNWQVINILLNTKVNPKLIDKTNFIKNTNNNSQTDTYSCNYINNLGKTITFNNEWRIATKPSGSSNLMISIPVLNPSKTAPTFSTSFTAEVYVNGWVSCTYSLGYTGETDIGIRITYPSGTQITDGLNYLVRFSGTITIS